MESKPGNLAGLAESSTKALVNESSTASEPQATDATAGWEDVSDPDEDDLDDLDDMLDEFNTAKPETKAPASTTSNSGPGRPPVADDPLLGSGEGLSDDDFAKQLQAGMAELMGELETSPEMHAQFESMLKEMGGLGETGPAPPPPSAPKPGSSKSKASAGAAGEESFQETIKKTMERMQASGDQATAAAVEDNSDDLLAEMMKAMQAGGMDGEGSEEDFSKMLLGMMEQLTNKEILYEPMKELDDKFPAWLEKNSASTPADDLKRYKEQQVFVREIVARFEQKTYKDENASDREYIVERMQKMQAAGSPPADLVGDMAAAQEAFAGPEEGCPTQ
ncbi:Peroxisome chaperone and import receptor [Ciborinia camelliae]|nr:Peroxisome chaperone and import receptor [Ciborinia camelliae]